MEPTPESRPKSVTKRQVIAFVVGVLIPVLGYMIFAPLPEEKATVVEDEERIVAEEKPAETAPVATSETEEETLLSFNTETLAPYNGEDPSLPIYIAFEGLVYDVTPGRKYYEAGASYNFLAGTDGTTLLKVIGGDIIKKKYTVIGTFAP